MRRFAALVSLLAACGSGAGNTAPPAPPPTPLPPEPACIADATADATSRARVACGELGPEAAIVETLDDLDGDSRPEQIVALDCGATGDCYRSLYLSGHGCAHFGGAMRALRLTQVGAWHHGVHDLESFESNGCAGMAGTITEWSFDGRTYVDTSTLTCACPDGTDAQRAPACPRPPNDVVAPQS